MLVRHGFRVEPKDLELRIGDPVLETVYLTECSRRTETISVLFTSRSPAPVRYLAHTNCSINIY